MRFKTPSLATLLLFFIAMVAQARWATYEDAALQLNDRTQIDTIQKDGKWTSEITEEIEVLKESGRESATARRLYYNEAAEKVAILEAYTVTESQKYKVELDAIEDKPIASFGQGFDQIRQILLVFPRVKVGSKVYLKYKIINTRVPLDNVFASVKFWGSGYYWKKSHNIIHSAIPLSIKINDPKHVLTITNKKKGNSQHIEIWQKKPLYTDTVNDGEWVHNRQLTWVSLSSLKKWEDLSGQFSIGWKKILDQPLPSRFRSIATIAAQKKTEVEQINAVTALLSETIQYMGDWRTVEGRLWARDLAKIEASHIGDCKDFSAVTAAILREIGFKAYVVFVNRGIDIRDFEEALPFYDLNHAMVKAVGKSGKVYWVDPTNVVSMAQGLFPDIAGKRALVLNPHNPTCEKIPEIQPFANQVVMERVITIQKDCSVDVKGKVVFQGESALEWAGKGLVLSAKGIEEEIILAAVGESLDKEDKRTVELPDLTKRIVEDLTFNYSYHQRHGVKRTNKGYYLEIASPFSLRMVEDQVSDMYLSSPPMTIKKVRFLQDGKIENPDLLNYEIKTPWVDVKRSCQEGKDQLKVEDVLVLKTRFIPAEALQGATYKKLADALKRYFDVGIVSDNG
jgi:hypothetical protein